LLARLRDIGSGGLRLVQLSQDLRLAGLEAGHLLRDGAFDLGGRLA
jgi:hypothetical protein